MIVSQLEGVMKAWCRAQEDLQEKCEDIELIYRHLVAKGSIGQDGITEQAFRKWAWDLITFEGVQLFVDIIYNHRERLIKYPSFVQA